MSKFRIALPSRAMAVALVALFFNITGLAYAATGGNFLLGRPNTATTQTGLTANFAGRTLQLTNTNTGATASPLGLTTAAGRPPFFTNSATKVANLNADKLDGIDSTGFLGKTAKATDSELLDGFDSSYFLPAYGKAVDADLLDGMDSTAFIQGAGQAGGQAVAIPAGQNYYLGSPLLGFLRLLYACPANVASNGTFAFNNDSGSIANVFVESGGANPSYYQMNPGDQVNFPGATTGDSWHIQAQGALGIITIEAASVHRSGSNDCHVQAQAVLTR
jgi:hypothetical protein